MTISAEIQKLETSELVTLFELDLSDIAPELTGDDRYLRFTSMVNEKGESVVWQGKTYTPYPIDAQGFDLNAQGSPPRPTLRAANINGALSDLCLVYNDLVLAKITRLRTFGRYLDAVNFTDGNADADPDQHYPADVYRIERKTEENDIIIEWELRWPFDLQGVLLPSRVIAENLCAWKYKSAECSWSPVPGKYFDLTDTATSAGNDDCSKKLTACQLRFGAKAVIPYGGFPGAGMVRR